MLPAAYVHHHVGADDGALDGAAVLELDGDGGLVHLHEEGGELHGARVLGGLELPSKVQNL